MSILEKFSHHQTFDTLTTAEKFQGALLVTLKAFAIVFIALILIMYSTKLMSYAIKVMEGRRAKSHERKNIEKKPLNKEPVVSAVQEHTVNHELIAVIAAAIAASTNQSIHNIHVQRIVKVSDPTPAWGLVGRAESMKNL